LSGCRTKSVLLDVGRQEVRTREDHVAFARLPLTKGDVVQVAGISNARQNLLLNTGFRSDSPSLGSLSGIRSWITSFKTASQGAAVSEEIAYYAAEILPMPESREDDVTKRILLLRQRRMDVGGSRAN